MNIWQDIPRMAEVVPEGERETAVIQHMEIGAVHRMRMLVQAIQGDPLASTPDGTYCKLGVRDSEKEGWTLMMTDTYMERVTQIEFFANAHGDVLIAGLGIGMILPPLCADPNVRSITVVELNEDVIRLVEAPIRRWVQKHHGLDAARKLAVVQADIYKYVPPKGSKYDCIYFDIWPQRSADNLPEMARLHQRFGRYKRSRQCWMGSWYRTELQQKLRREEAEMRAIRQALGDYERANGHPLPGLRSVLTEDT
jgi:hypothetical protein